MTKHNRRNFIKKCSISITKWSPLLSMLGLKLHRYANPLNVGWQGWVTWCNKLIGFIKLDGSFFPFFK